MQVQAPKARPIPARGEAPCTVEIDARGLKARPILIPQMFIVRIQSILPQKRTQLITKRLLAMMRLLPIDVSQQRIQIGRPHRERPITDLPREIRDPLRLQPSRRGRLQLLHQLRNGLFFTETNRKMDMIGNTPNPVTFASSISCDCREIREQIGTNFVVEQRQSVFGAEDHMNHNKSKRSWHSENYRSVFQTSEPMGIYSRGVAPRWYRVAPLALVIVTPLLVGCRGRSAEDRPFSAQEVAGNYEYYRDNLTTKPLGKSCFTLRQDGTFDSGTADFTSADGPVLPKTGRWKLSYDSQGTGLDFRTRRFPLRASRILDQSLGK